MKQSALISQYRRVWNLEHSEPFSSLAPFLPSSLLSVQTSGKDATLLQREPHLLQLAVDEPRVPHVANVAKLDDLFIAAGDAEGTVSSITDIVMRDFDGVFPAVLDELGASALHYAALAASPQSTSNPILDYLIGLTGASEWATHKNAAGMTPLMAACVVGAKSSVDSLLNARNDEAHVNAVSANGCSALHLAIDGGHTDIALLLVQRGGASVFSRATFRLDQARSRGQPYVSPILEEFGVTALELAALKHKHTKLPDLLIEAVLASMSRGDSSNSGSLNSVVAAVPHESPRLLSAQKKRAIAQSLLAEGFESSTVAEVQQLLLDMLGCTSFTEVDVDDVVSLLDTNAIHTSTVLSSEEEFGGNSVAATTNRLTPSHAQNSQLFHVAGISLDTVRHLTREGGSAVAIANIGHLLLHGHHGTLPICLRHLLSDFVVSLDVSVAALRDVVEIRPLFDGPSAPIRDALASDKALIFISRDVRNRLQARQPFQRAALVLESASSDAVELVTFDAPPSLLRSICEVTNASPVNFDESLGHCCLAQSRDVVFPRITGVQSIIPYSSLFADFDRVLFHAVATSRVARAPTTPPTGGSTGSYDSKADLLTRAIEAHADSFVSFLVSSPFAQLEQRHLVTAAQLGTATAFQLVFSAMGSAVSTLSTVDPLSGETPVTAAIACGTCLHLTSMLQLASRNLQSLNAYGYSPLMVACLVGNESALLHLISLGANVNEVCPRGMTPLIAAIASTVDRMVMPLVQNGAFVTLADANGLTPLRAAELFGSSALFPLLHQHDAKSTPAKGNEVACIAQVASPVTLLSASAMATLDQLRSLELYFAEISKHHTIPGANVKPNVIKHEDDHRRTSTSEVGFIRSTPLLPSGALQIPVRAHSVTVARSDDHAPLYLNTERMINDVCVILKAAILDPHIISEYGPFSKQDRSAVLFLLEAVREAVEKLVERFLKHPPAEAATLLELEVTFQLAQAAVHAAHRFATVLYALHQLRTLAAAATQLCEHVAHPVWLRAQNALPTDTTVSPPGVVAPLVLPTDFVLQALEATYPLVKDQLKMVKAIDLLLDPFASGITTVFEFSCAHEILSMFSEEGLSSLHVLLGYHAVFFNGLPEINRMWLRRAAPYDYVVAVGPIGVSILTSRTKSQNSIESSFVETRTYNSVSSLLELESDILRA